MKNQYDIKDFKSLDDAVLWLENESPPYPEMPKKPSLTKYNATPQDYREYASALETYANEKEEYDKLLKEYKEKRMNLETTVQKFIWYNTGLNDIVPEQYREKVWSYAYDLGHAYGYSEIQNYLLDLVDIFRD
jgi:hypothetical protein